MNMFSLLTVLGCKPSSAQPHNKTSHGNFTIHRQVFIEKSSGKSFGRKYETASYLIKYKVFYKGQEIRFPSNLQRGTDYNFPWRVFILAESRVPTLIAASQNVFVISEEEGKLKVEKLNHGSLPFGTLQWLDETAGQPGEELQFHDPQNDNFLDSSLVLKGGSFLLINRFTVLNCKTLEQYPFNKRSEHEFNGWTLALDQASGFHTAVAFSAFHKQVVFRALKMNREIEGTYLPGLLAFNYETNTHSSIPFSRENLRPAGLDDIRPMWVSNHFEWDSTGQLRLKRDFVPPPWQGKLNFIDERIIHYELQPVKPTIIQVFLKFLRSARFDPPIKDVTVIDQSVQGSTQQIFRIKMDGKTFTLTYDQTARRLTFDREFMEPHSDEYRQMIINIGGRFNTELREGMHDAHFGNFGEIPR